MNRRLAILSLLCALVILSMTGCGRVRVLENAPDTPIGFDRHMVTSSQTTPENDDARNISDENLAEKAAKPPVGSESQSDAGASSQPTGTTQPSQLNASQTTESHDDFDDADPASSGERNNADNVSDRSQAQTSNDGLSNRKGGKESQTDSSNDSSGKKDKKKTAPNGPEVDQNTSIGGDENEKRDPNSKSDLSEVYSSRLATYKDAILSKNQSLMCAAKKVYGEYPESYSVINSGTDLGIALKYPELTNIGEIQMVAASDKWVADRNPDIIVKLVPSNVLGAGVTNTGKAQEVVAGLKSREWWNTVSAVQNDGIVLMSADFAETEVGQRLLSIYLGMTAYPSAYSDEYTSGGIAAMYRYFTGKDFDGIYFYPEEPHGLKDSPEA